MTSLTKKRLVALGALTIAGLGLTIVAFGGIEDNLVYFWDPQELLSKGDAAHGATVRLGGVVKEKSVSWNPNTLDLQFAAGIAPEEGGAAVVVKAHGAPPQMFREGIGVVVEGTYDGAVFHADRVMVKHSNEYRAPAEGERPESLFGTLLEGGTQP